MTFRYFRKQRRGVVQMGHAPPYLFAGEVIDATASIVMQGPLSGPATLGGRSLTVQGPGATNYAAAAYQTDGTGLFSARIWADTAGFDPEVRGGMGGDETHVFGTVTIFGNNTGTSPITYTFENGDGTIFGTLDTVSNIVSTHRHSEVVIVKYRVSDGQIAWIKRLYEPTAGLSSRTWQFGTLESQVAGVQVVNDTVFVSGNIMPTTHNDTNTTTYTFGVGDPHASSFSPTRKRSAGFVVRFDLDDGAIQQDSLDADPYPSNDSTVAVNQLSIFNRNPRWVNSNGEYAQAATGNDRQNGANLNENFAPAPYLPPPSAVTTGQGFMSLHNANRTPKFAFSAGAAAASGTFNLISEIGLSDTRAVFAGSPYNMATSPTQVFYRDIGGEIAGPSININDVLLVEWDYSGNIVWHKRVAVINGTNSAPGMASPVFNPAHGSILLPHQCQTTGASQFTWGPGEGGAVSHTFAAQGAAVAVFDDTTGDFQWVQVAENTGTGTDANVFDAGLRPDGLINALIGFVEQIDLNVLGAPDTVNVGAATAGILAARYDPATGAYVDNNVIATPSSNFSAAYVGFGPMLV